MNNAHVVLGVRPDATHEEIRTAYRERARSLRPERFMRADGTVPEGVHETFIELNQAFRSLLLDRPLRPVSVGRVPDQRRAPVSFLRAGEHDPFLLLLALPHECPEPWSVRSLDAWEHVLVAAGQHLMLARWWADSSGATGHQHQAATAHALLTITVARLHGPRILAVLTRLESAYAVLERQLSDSVLAALPERGTTVPPAAAG